MFLIIVNDNTGNEIFLKLNTQLFVENEKWITKYKQGMKYDFEITG